MVTEHSIGHRKKWFLIWKSLTNQVLNICQPIQFFSVVFRYIFFKRLKHKPCQEIQLADWLGTLLIVYPNSYLAKLLPWFVWYTVLLKFKLSHLEIQNPQLGTNGRIAPLQLQCLLEVEQEFKRVAAAQTSNTPNLTLRFPKVVQFSLK